MKTFVVASTLKPEDRESVVQFLLQLGAPVYLEGISGIREDERLEHLRITYIHNLWEYPIQRMIRIGGVPTFRPWRDLENKRGEIDVISFSHLPFSGLSWGEVNSIHDLKDFETTDFKDWKEKDIAIQEHLQKLFVEEPQAEPSIFHQLSKRIPEGSLVYLGNSMPIREWDLAATYQQKHFQTYASRGVNGIDGQLATFFGMCQPDRENWAIVGDLTALYDMSSPWILKQLQGMKIRVVVINNSGGKIFDGMFKQKQFQNRHSFSFRPLADMWGMEYGEELIELVPDEEATHRFWDQYEILSKSRVKNRVGFCASHAEKTG